MSEKQYFTNEASVEEIVKATMAQYKKDNKEKEEKEKPKEN